MPSRVRPGGYNLFYGFGDDGFNTRVPRATDLLWLSPDFGASWTLLPSTGLVARKDVGWKNQSLGKDISSFRTQRF